MNDSYFWKKLCNGRTIKYIVLLLTFLTLNGLVGYYYQNNTRLTDGSYIYPLDYTYIHLAMAKNWALYDTWGVTAGQFSSVQLHLPRYILLYFRFRHACRVEKES
jgi:hypothetical protein